MPLIPLYILVPFMGLFVGSFLNVLIYRIPRGEEWVITPSHCPKCGHRLEWYEMLPVLSWLALRGKCRSCGGLVSPRYPAIEIINGGLWLICVLTFRGSAFLPVSLALSSCLLALSVIDWDTSEIPDGFHLVILAAGVIYNGYALSSGSGIWRDNLIGLFSVSVPLLILAVVTNGGMGGGDIKLTAVCGLVLGWQNMLLALALASIIGAAVMLPRHIIERKGRHATVPFGPFLSAGIFVAMCFGNEIIARYLALFYF